jgi:hypothetical protein
MSNTETNCGYEGLGKLTYHACYLALYTPNNKAGMKLLVKYMQIMMNIKDLLFSNYSHHDL